MEGVGVVKTHFLSDNRGAFGRLFCKRNLEPIIKHRDIVQINFSLTESRGSIRGMHFQHSPYSEMKLVRCLKGRVWDVVVDLRSGSKTFLKWHAEELSPDSSNMIVIPEGCAHGFQTLEPCSELLYLHTNYYAPEAESGLAFDDQRLDIPWPLSVTDISVRDLGHTKITNHFTGIEV